ncbi:MAG: endolytic transglycosylase MltG [Rickettsiales bacterium]|jgi:UPF0755 protein|nr:endolytic transglycosylase MltG [Rickettsiales bacterium]
MPKKIIIFPVIFLLGGLLVFMKLREYLDRKIDSESILYVKKNTGISQIVTDLKNIGAIENPTLFKFILKIKMRSKKIKYIKYGEYLLNRGDTVASVLDKLINNRIFYRSITIPEGFSNKSVFSLLEKNEFLSGEISNRESIAEGSLLAETYYFRRDDSRNSLLERMQKDMEEFINNNWETAELDPSIATKKDLLILASIVEKESANVVEKKIIASVFLNRLRKKMRLQSDPTVIYSFAFGDVEKEGKNKISVFAKIKSPHNTYMVGGLPPTAICNPGKESIMAVLHPAKSDYLFFVAYDNGKVGFTTNYRDHLKLVNKLRVKNNQQLKQKKTLEK